MRKLMVLFLLTAVATVAKAQVLDGDWKGKLQAGPQTLTCVLHISQAKKAVQIAVIEQGAVRVPMEVKALTADSVGVELASLGIRYNGKLKEGKLVGTFQQMTFMAPLTFEPGKVVFNRPQEPVKPYPYRTEEVTFGNPKAGATLAGTLSFPVGYDKKKPVPVLLMVTGSGPENRDEEVFQHKFFLVIADFLARNGIATLRYDDRGVGQSTGVFATATTADFAEDAAQGINYLRSRKEFAKVGLLGHSEGGIIGYMLGSRKLIDCLVSLAGPACRIDTLMYQQLNLLAKAQGSPVDVVSSVADTRKLLLEKSGGAWTKYFVDMDVAPYVKATKCPVLALGGTKDLNVPVALNVPCLQQYLPKKGKNKINVYDGLNHEFQHCATGNPAEAVSIDETFAPEVLQDIVEWIKSL